MTTDIAAALTPNTARNFAARTFADPDVIIIGSGMSSLTCGAILSMEGKKVMLLEQHDTPGGSMHCFKQGEEWISAGWHYVGAPLGMWRLFWDYLTQRQAFTADTKETLNTNYGVGSMSADGVYEAMGIKEADMARLYSYTKWLTFIKLLPAPAALVLWLIYKFTGKNREASMNWGEWCKKVTGKKEEQEIWWTQRGDHGCPREKSCALIANSVVYSFRGGAVRVAGGPRETCMRMVDRITKNGGAVLLKAPVSQINVERNRVTGVVVEGVTISAKRVIVPGAHLMQQLLKEKTPRGIQEALKLGRSPSHGNVFLTFQGKTHKDIGLPDGNVWYKDYLFINYNDTPTGCIVYIIFEMDYIARGPGYEEGKERETAKAFETAASLFPKLKEHSEYDAGTPATTQQYIGSAYGCSYGLAAPPERYNNFRMVRNLGPKTGISGLYLTGQDVMVPGVVGAEASAFITAQAVQYPGISGFWKNVFKDVIVALFKENAKLGLPKPKLEF